MILALAIAEAGVGLLVVAGSFQAVTERQLPLAFLYLFRRPITPKDTRLDGVVRLILATSLQATFGLLAYGFVLTNTIPAGKPHLTVYLLILPLWAAASLGGAIGATVLQSRVHYQRGGRKAALSVPGG
jgi:hypothetical protein